ncbi:hypothetical protein Tco_0355526 [Tanacetum coccineum]
MSHQRMIDDEDDAEVISRTLGDEEEEEHQILRLCGCCFTCFGLGQILSLFLRRETEGRSNVSGEDVGYGITTHRMMILETSRGHLVLTLDLGRILTAFESRVRQDTDEIYTRLDDEQSGRQLLASRLNMLFRDRRAHVRTARLMETEARMSKEAWGRSMDVSDLARTEVMSLRTTVLAQQSQIREL